MSQELYFSIMAGISVPLHKVEYLQWKISYEKQYSLMVKTDRGAELPEFTIYTNMSIVLKHYLYAENKTEPLLVDEDTVAVDGSVEDILNSEFLSGLSKKGISTVQKYITRIVKLHSRINSGEASLSQLATIIPPNELTSNESYQINVKHIVSREQSLQENIKKLTSYISRKSMVINEESTISQARAWKEWDEKMEMSYAAVVEPNSEDEDHLDIEDHLDLPDDDDVNENVSDVSDDDDEDDTSDVIDVNEKNV